MRKVLVTGARGFIGRNLVAHLKRREDLELRRFDLDSEPRSLGGLLAEADFVFHLAGVNRPEREEEFIKGNVGLTAEICDHLRRRRAHPPKLVMTSSIQAALDNPYGQSKRQAEETLEAYAKETGGPISILRLKNVFGKWCRPNYNSVTATFCHNIAHDLPISISDPEREIELVYIDDVVAALINELASANAPEGCYAPDTIPCSRVKLGDLAGRIQVFHEMRESLLTPNFADHFNQCLYATYLSYREPETLEYGLLIRADPRGSLAEFIKSEHFGQIFVSRTLPGITRGNHYHHTKTEKFFVIDGRALIRMRHIEGAEIQEFSVEGKDYRVVDIPPGVTHSIQNIGENELITLFWASEILDQDQPDTYYLEV